MTVAPWSSPRYSFGDSKSVRRTYTGSINQSLPSDDIHIVMCKTGRAMRTTPHIAAYQATTASHSHSQRTLLAEQKQKSVVENGI